MLSLKTENYFRIKDSEIVKIFHYEKSVETKSIKKIGLFSFFKEINKVNKIII